MPMRKGNKEKKIYFSPKEWDIVCERSKKAGMRTGTFIRAIAVQGELKFYDMKELQHLLRSFNSIGTNLNQIATVANSTKSIYQKDIEDLQEQFTYFDKVMKNYLHELKPKVLL